MADMDIDALELTANLFLEDIGDILSTRTGDGRLSHEDYAFLAQAQEMWEFLADIEEGKYARDPRAIQTPDGRHSDSTSVLAAHYRRRALEIRELLSKKDRWTSQNAKKMYFRESNAASDSNSPV